jgi:GNAT superfamily N-acetyltransferase
MERGDLATEIGISVDQDACRCGLGKHLLLAALELAMRMGVVRAHAIFRSDSIATIRIDSKETYRSRPRGGGSNLLLWLSNREAGCFF